MDPGYWSRGRGIPIRKVTKYFELKVIYTILSFDRNKSDDIVFILSDPPNLLFTNKECQDLRYL